MNLHKKYTAKLYSFLVIDVTLVSDNPLPFRKNLLERIAISIATSWKNISPYHKEKIDEYEYLTGEVILPFDQSRVIEQAKFTYLPVGKAFEKQIKTPEDQGRKQVEALRLLKLEENQQDPKSVEGIFPKVMRTNKIKNEIDEIKNWEEKNLKKYLNQNKQIRT